MYPTFHFDQTWRNIKKDNDYELDKKYYNEKLEIQKMYYENKIKKLKQYYEKIIIDKNNKIIDLLKNNK
jgi:hypothetical protein